MAKARTPAQIRNIKNDRKKELPRFKADEDRDYRGMKNGKKDKGPYG